MTQALKETSVQATESLRGVEEDPEANENMRKGRLPRGIREDFTRLCAEDVPAR